MVAPPALEYAPRQKWYQRRRFQHWVWIALWVALAPFVIGGGCALWFMAHEAWTIRENRRLLAACERYAAPPDQVVFEMKGGTIVRSVLAPPWAAWWSDAWGYPTVFLHGRRDLSPTQFLPASQLIAVEITPHLMDTYDGRTVLDRPLLCFRSSQVWTVSTSRSSGMPSGSTQFVILPEPGDHVRVFAGRIDPSSPDAFTFDVEYNGQRQTVEGQLRGGLTLLRPAGGDTLSPEAWKHATFWVPDGATLAQAAKVSAVAASNGQPSLSAWPWPAWWVAPGKLPTP